MSTSVTNVVSHFPSAENGFTTTLASTISSGATTVPLNSVAGYTNGEVVVFVIDPSDATKKQTFTGIVDTAGVQITSVVWTAGTNQAHAGGATVVDYATATHISMVTKGLLVEHNQDGTHNDVTADTVTATTITADEFVVAGASANNGWTVGLPTPDTVTYNGNRSYDLVFSSNDITDTVSNGMRLKLTRTTAAPTQCTSLNGTNQYWSKTSPSGMTFTDDFVVSAWVKISAYQAAGQMIVSRYNGTSGWAMQIASSGIVQLFGFNAGVANYSVVQSYQSVPLNKWVHITAQLDMSTFTATTTTSYVMLDGLGVPASVIRSGTNPTALVQAGNLEVGSWNGGLLPFSGKIAQVAIYSAKVTQATILASMNQTLTGSETNLVSAYTFNNSINDLSANANNLTASGGAGFATDSPFNSTEYGIITANSFSTDTTLTVQVPEGYAIPTSGGVSAVAYSTQDVPYGFPRDNSKWDVVSLHRTQTNQNSTTTFTTFANVDGHRLTVPIGPWEVVAELPGFSSNLNSNEFVFTEDTITGNAISSHTKTEQVHRIQVSAASTGFIPKRLSFPYTASTATTFKLWNAQSSGTTTCGMDGDNQLFQFTARLNYV